MFGDDIMFDYNRDGKSDYKDQITEMMIINKDAKKQTHLHNNNKKNGSYGCLVFIIIFIVILFFI